jgi:hypothetical protein
MLFELTSYKVSGLENVLERIRTIITLGMSGAEDVNREDVQVFDTVSGKSCFDWHRNFPATYSRVSSACNGTVWRIRGDRIGKHALDLSPSDGLSVRNPQIGFIPGDTSYLLINTTGRIEGQLFVNPRKTKPITYSELWNSMFSSTES